MTESPDAGGATPAPALYNFTFPDDQLDGCALQVVERLEEAGHAAYLVGGCVRDLLLGVRPKDYDVATSATPRQAKRVFRNSRIIGRRFRLVHVVFGDKIVELSTFRRRATFEPAPDNGGREEGAQEPEGDDEPDDLLIRSDNVFGTPREDALRRDFTINALFYSPSRRQIIDYVGGIQDLKARRLATIGDASIRFREDPVRIIRALKFSVRMRLELTPETRAAVEQHAEELSRSAPPRILEEIYKILGSGVSAGTFTRFLEAGVLKTILPTIHELASAEGAPEAVRTFAHLRALDQADGGERRHGNAVLLGALLLPLYEAARATAPSGSGEEESPDGPPPGERLIGHLLSSCPVLCSVSRREREHLRSILVAQRRFIRSEGSSRGFSVGAFMRKPYFDEAFKLFAIASAATGEAAEDLDRWRRRLGQAAGSDAAGSSGEPDDAPRDGEDQDFPPSSCPAGSSEPAAPESSSSSSSPSSPSSPPPAPDDDDDWGTEEGAEEPAAAESPEGHARRRRGRRGGRRRRGRRGGPGPGTGPGGPGPAPAEPSMP